MEQLLGIHEYLMGNYGPGIYFPIGFLILIGIAGQWMLYYKCDLPGVACIVPVWNVTTFLKIMGRPSWQSLIVMIPPLLVAWGLVFAENTMVGYSVAGVAFVGWAIYMARVYYELCICFNRTKKRDYLLCLALNGFYVLWLGLSDGTEYHGTYEEAKKKVLTEGSNEAVGEAQMA